MLVLMDYPYSTANIKKILHTHTIWKKLKKNNGAVKVPSINVDIELLIMIQNYVFNFTASKGTKTLVMVIWEFNLSRNKINYIGRWFFCVVLRIWGSKIAGKKIINFKPKFCGKIFFLHLNLIKKARKYFYCNKIIIN